jgi:hypothetical protein
MLTERLVTQRAALMHNLAAIRPGVAKNSAMDQKEMGAVWPAAESRSKTMAISHPRSCFMGSYFLFF